MLEKYAVSIPLCLAFVGCLSFISSMYGGTVDNTIKEDGNTAGSCTEKRDDTELAKKEPQLCSCGRHVQADNYYCVEAIYYDNNDSEEDSVSPPLSYRPDAPFSKAKPNSSKKVHFTGSALRKPSQDVNPPKKSDPSTTSPIVSSVKRQHLNEKESPNLKSPSQSYFEPPNNHGPSPSHSTPCRLGSGAFWKVPETDLSNTKASPDPSSDRILELEALLASSEAQRLQRDDNVRKELADLDADREKARVYTSELEGELNQQRAFTAEAYAEVNKLEKIRAELSTEANNDVTAHDKLKDELRSVREELERTNAKADENLARHNNILQELSGVRDELETAKANAAIWENAYQDTQKLLSTAKKDLEAVNLQREHAPLELKQQPEHDMPMEPECNEPQDTDMDPGYIQNKVSEAHLEIKPQPEHDTPMEPECNEPQDTDTDMDPGYIQNKVSEAHLELKQQPEHDTPMEPECNAPQDKDMDPDYIWKKVSQAQAGVALVRLQLSELDEKLEKKSNALKESKKAGRIKAKRINELTAELDKEKKDYKLTESSLHSDIKRLEKITTANPTPRQDPRVSSVMNYTNYSQKQLVNVVKKYVQDCEDLELECERNLEEGKREGCEKGRRAGKRELAEKLVPLYLATGTRMARDFVPAVLDLEQTVGPDAKAVTTAKQTSYAELIQMQKDLSRIMRESGLPPVQKVQGKSHAREETAVELLDLQEDYDSSSKRLRSIGELQHSTFNGHYNSAMSEEEEL